MDAQSYLAQVKALLPALRERAPRVRGAAAVPDETIKDFQAGGLLRALQPRAGAASSSTRGSSTRRSPRSRRLPVERLGARRRRRARLAARAVPRAGAGRRLGRRTRARCSLVVVRADREGRARRRRLPRSAGRWSFSSGCDHCQWVFLGGWSPPTARASRRTCARSSLPRSRLPHRRQLARRGPRGHGQQGHRRRGAFVPEHRTHRFVDGFKLQSPGNAVNPAPLYRLPFGQLFALGVAVPAIGAAQGALDAYRAMQPRSASRRATARRSPRIPFAQRVCARRGGRRSTRRARVAAPQLRRDDGAAPRRARSIPLEPRVRFRSTRRTPSLRGVEAVDLLFEASGGRAIFLDSPIQRVLPRRARGARPLRSTTPTRPARDLRRRRARSGGEDRATSSSRREGDASMTAVRRLGYLGFEVSDLAAWERSRSTCSASRRAARGRTAALALRMDDHAQRIVAPPGAADDLAVPRLGGRRRGVARARSARGCAPRASRSREGTPEDAARAPRARACSQLARSDRHARSSSSAAPERAAEPFRSAARPVRLRHRRRRASATWSSRATDPQATERFYCELLGLRLSDRIELELAPGFPLDITFLHANPRHHSVAFAAAPHAEAHPPLHARGRRAWTTSGRAYDRALDGRRRITQHARPAPERPHVLVLRADAVGLRLRVRLGRPQGRRRDLDRSIATTSMSAWGHHMPGRCGRAELTCASAGTAAAITRASTRSATRRGARPRTASRASGSRRSPGPTR